MGWDQLECGGSYFKHLFGRHGNPGQLGAVGH